MLHGINTHKICPTCNTINHLEVRGYDETWRDGEVWCKACNVYVRQYDAG